MTEPAIRTGESPTSGPPRPSATAPLRMWGYAAVLTAIAFVQSPGRLAADTKLDLVVDPWGFLRRALDMWDGQAAFGQVQNQAYGYLWPMGPFFGVGELLRIPDWIVQRLWWALLLCLAFFGVVRLCRRLGLGGPGSQVVAGFAFALSPHAVTVIGASSVELWPTALAPWVLLPLVDGVRGGSERRAAARSALVVACCGGVNAVAVSAVLPLGALWIWTRTAGARRWRLFWWWTGCVVLATVWWWVPLLLMGGYAAPFLDYIESAAVTTSTTGLVDIVNGTSNWVAYVSPDTYPAGHQVATTAFLVIDAAVVAGLGLAGAALRDNPHRRFLLLSVVAGATLVGLGYTGELHGWFAAGRQELLDGALAPFRNLHKYDVVLRLPLVLGLAHLLGRLAAARAGSRHAAGPLSAVGMVPQFTVGVALVGLVVPWLTGVAPLRAPSEVPEYWTEAAEFLAAADDGTVSLLVPASAFGDSIWGLTRDEVLQGLADSPWAVRNVVPLAEAGSVVFLDAVTEALESGRPSPVLADVLAAHGVGRLVVRNDLERLTTGAPDPVVLHQVLDRSPGLQRVASFGPLVGQEPAVVGDDGGRVVFGSGRAARYPAIEVYDLEPESAPVVLVPADEVVRVAGSPGATLAGAPDVLPGGALPLLAGDDGWPGFEEDDRSPVVLTDTLRRREKDFAAVRRNESATRSADAASLVDRPEPNHRFLVDQRRWSTTEVLEGVTAVEASSSRADVTSPGAKERGRLPFAAVDGDPSTAWHTARGRPADGQSWTVTFEQPQDLGAVTLAVAPESDAAVTDLVLASGDRRRTVEAPEPGKRRTYPLGWRGAEELSVEAVGEPALGPFALAEVSVDGVEPRRLLQLPAPAEGDEVSAVLLSRDRAAAACLLVGRAVSCEAVTVSEGEDGNRLARRFRLPDDGRYGLRLTGSSRSGAGAVAALRSRLPVQAVASSQSGDQLATSGPAAVDGDPGTTWVSATDDDAPSLTVTWRQRVTLRSLRMSVSDAAPAARPSRVTLRWDDEAGRSRARRLDLDMTGRAAFPALTARRVTLTVEDSLNDANVQGGSLERLPPGASEVAFNGSEALTGAQRSRPVEVPCGRGPTVAVEGRAVETSARASIRDLMTGAAVALSPCGSGVLRLDEGPVIFDASPSPLFTVDQATLSRVRPGERSSAPAGSGEATQHPELRHWDDVERTVGLPARAHPALLVVAQNANRGWRATLAGQPLAEQRVDGWLQGWWVPAGQAVEVELRFTPQDPYRAGLLAGVAGVLAVLALATVTGRRGWVHRPGLEPGAGWPVPEALLAVAAAGLWAGWPAAGVLLGLGAATLLIPRVRLGAPVAAGGLVLAAAGILAVTRTQDGALSSATGQLLVAVALGVALVASGTNGPRFLNRRNGRSTQ